MHGLQNCGTQVDVREPWANADEARHEYGPDLVQTPQDGGYDAIVLAVAHDQFKALGQMRCAVLASQMKCFMT